MPFISATLTTDDIDGIDPEDVSNAYEFCPDCGSIMDEDMRRGPVCPYCDAINGEG